MQLLDGIGREIFQFGAISAGTGAYHLLTPVRRSPGRKRARMEQKRNRISPKLRDRQIALVDQLYRRHQNRHRIENVVVLRYYGNYWTVGTGSFAGISKRVRLLAPPVDKSMVAEKRKATVIDIF